MHHVLAKNCIALVHQPSYSLDIAPCENQKSCERRNISGSYEIKWKATRKLVTTLKGDMQVWMKRFEVCMLYSYFFGKLESVLDLV